jgi:hypothetical protein
MHEIFGERFKELLGDGESALSKPDGALLDATRLKRTNLGDGLVAFAEDDSLPSSDSGEVTGQVGFGLMNVKSNHGSNINQVVN